jgi:hypothetical protein
MWLRLAVPKGAKGSAYQGVGQPPAFFASSFTEKNHTF